MVDKNEVPRPIAMPASIQPIPTIVPEIVAPIPSPIFPKKIIIVEEEKTITIPKNYDRAEQFLKENYFKRDL